MGIHAKPRHLHLPVEGLEGKRKGMVRTMKENNGRAYIFPQNNKTIHAYIVSLTPI
jgi:hypothetical protein